MGLLNAVTSINTFFVSIEIFEKSEFIIGGTEHTLSSESNISGNTGLSLIRCKYYLSLWFYRRANIPNPSTSVYWLSGVNLKLFGSWATYLNGPLILSKSWVPMDAYFLALQKVACNFYCALIKDL